MKLSDVKGDHTLDVIADLIDPIANIAQDKDIAKMFKREKVPEGMEANEFFAQRMRAGMPVLLRGHKRDIIKILATIEGVTPEEYAEEMNLVKLIRDFMELVTDETFLGFLASSPIEKDKDAPGDASVSFTVL